MTEKELSENIKSVWASAELVYSTKDFTSAAILYFKAAFSILDLILLRSDKKVPKDHTERFRMLEGKYPDMYEFLDKFFKVYRDTYTTTIDKETCERVKGNVKRIIEEYEVHV